MNDYEILIRACKNVCCLKYKNHYYLIDIQNCLQMEITGNLYECIKIIKEKKYNEIMNNNYTKETSFLLEAINKGLLSSDISIEESPIDYLNLSFTPIHKCNFNCRYCFANSGKTYIYEEKDFTYEKIMRTIDFFFLEYFPNMHRYRIEFVSGGEPLLSFNMIKRTVEYIEKFQSDYNKDVQIILCTNGSLLSKNYVRFLDKHNVSIGISIDGEKKAHDANRVYSNGKGTYDDVIKGVKTILEDDQIGNRTKHIWGLSVINEKNYDLISIIKHYKQIGIKAAQMKIEWKTTSNKIENSMLYKQFSLAYENLAKFLLDQFSENEIEYLLMITNDNDQFGKVIKKYITGIYASRRCEAGRYKFVVCPNGDIYPCYGFIGFKDMRIGSVSKHYINLKLFESADVKNNAKCSNCDIRYICGGDCYYNAFINTGSINRPSEYYCYIQRRLCELGVWLLTEMRKTNFTLYEQFAKEVIHCDNIRKQ